jgi:hypothetical protein
VCLVCGCVYGGGGEDTRGRGVCGCSGQWGVAHGYDGVDNNQSFVCHAPTTIYAMPGFLSFERTTMDSRR